MKPAVCVCLGLGWDSSAMLIEMHKRGQRPDLISFGDHGGERNGTYEFLPIFDQWLKDVGFPPITRCRYVSKPVTAARYRQAVVDTAERLKLALSEEQIDRLSGIVGNCLANETMPGITFGPKSCSIKHKLVAQEFY